MRAAAYSGKPNRAQSPRSLAAAILFGAAALILLAPNPAQAEALDQHGKAHSWKGEIGEHTVVDFAASWCEPCRKTLPALHAYADAHPQLRILVISVDEDASGRDRLVEDLQLRLPVLWDQDFEIAEHFRPKGMPATFVLDPNGKIVHSHVGSSQEEWQKLVSFLEGLPPKSGSE